MSAIAPRIPPGIVALSGGLVIWAIARYVPGSRIAMPGTRVMAAALLGAGAVLMLLGVASFLRARHGLRSVVTWGPGEKMLAESVK